MITSTYVSAGDFIFLGREGKEEAVGEREEGVVFVTLKGLRMPCSPAANCAPCHSLLLCL